MVGSRRLRFVLAASAVAAGLAAFASCTDYTGPGGEHPADAASEGAAPDAPGTPDGADEDVTDAGCVAPPADPAFLSDAVEIDTSGPFVCAVRASGQVVCWGANGSGQLGVAAPVDGGDGGTATSSRPVVVAGIPSATHVAVGYQHACAVVTGGQVWCWGNGAKGETGLGGTAMTPPQVVYGSGFNPLTSVVAISAGGAFTCVLTQGGGVQCWGDNGKGEISTSSFATTDTPQVVPGVGVATALSAGFFHVCAVSGTVAKCWGGSDHGELGKSVGPDGSAPIEYANGGAAVARAVASTVDTCVIDTAHGVQCSGYNLSGQLGGTNAGDQILTPYPIPELATGDVVDIDIGFAHTCGLRTDASAFCLSATPMDALGAGPLDASDTDNSARTVLAVEGAGVLGPVASIKAGGASYGGAEQHSCAIVKPACAKSGQVVCWGANTVGQLGDGTTTPRSRPVKVLAP